MNQNSIFALDLNLKCFVFDDTKWDIVPASSRRTWMNETDGHANKCLPLLAANQMGWHILSPTDFSVVWDGRRNADAVKVILDDLKFTKTITSHFGFGTFTFNLPYIFRTSQEIGLLVRGATNFWVDGATPLDGFVETNWSNYSFTMNWKCTTPNKIVKFNRGDPICMIIPYPIRLLENVKIEKLPFEQAPADLKETFVKWSAYRDQFNSRTERKEGDWQKDYFMGRISPFNGDGEDNKGCPHRTKFNLPKFQ